MGLGQDLGKNIRQYRKQKKLTQKQLGDELGYTAKQISCYESGKQTPPIEKLEEICNILGCELGALLGDEDYKEGSRFVTEYSRRTGLSAESFDYLSKCVHSSRRKEEYFGYGERVVLDQILCSEKFYSLIHSMTELYGIIHDIEVKETAFRDELGEETYKEVLAVHSGPNDYINDESFQNTLSDKVMSGLIKYDELLGAEYDSEYSIKIARYDTNVAFERMLLELFPDLLNI